VSADVRDDVGGHPIFRAWSRRSQSWGPDDRWSAAFGGDVLRALTDGLDGYLAGPDWRYWRTTSAVERKFSEMLERAMRSYTNRSLDAAEIITELASGAREADAS
jgi:hypothetical protein